MRRLAGVLLAVVLVVAGTAAASARTAAPATSTAPRTAPPVSISFADSDPIFGLVGDPHTSAVWFFTFDRTSVLIDRFDADGRLRSWPVLSSRQTMGGGDLQYGLAVGPSGGVWFAIGRTLIRLEPATGAVRIWAIPTQRPNLEALRDRPRHYTARVTDLAVGPRGRVVLALDPDSSLATFDAATDRWGRIDLPTTSDLVSSLAYRPDGLVAAGFYDLAHGGGANRVLLAHAGRSHTTRVPGAQAYELTTDGAKGFLAGTTSPVVISTDGTVTRQIAPRSLVSTDDPYAGLVPLPHHRIAGLVRGGVTIFSSDARSVKAAAAGARVYASPVVGCGPPGGPPPTAPTHEVCREGVETVAADHDGDIWIITGPNDDTVALVPPSAFRSR
jgi:hypothetical protein